jgi:hypothetical protein
VRWAFVTGGLRGPSSLTPLTRRDSARGTRAALRFRKEVWEEREDCSLRRGCRVCGASKKACQSAGWRSESKTCADADAREGASWARSLPSSIYPERSASELRVRLQHRRPRGRRSDEHSCAVARSRLGCAARSTRCRGEQSSSSLRKLPSGTGASRACLGRCGDWERRQSTHRSWSAGHKPTAHASRSRRPGCAGSGDDLFDVRLRSVGVRHGPDLHRAPRRGRALEPWMLARNLCPEVEHQARVLLALGKEASEVAFVRERRRLP